MKLFLLILSLTIPLFLYVVVGKYLWGIPIQSMRVVLGLTFLFLSGLFIKNQRYILAFLFLLLSLTLTTKGELFFEDGR